MPEHTITTQDGTGQFTTNVESRPLTRPNVMFLLRNAQDLYFQPPDPKAGIERSLLNLFAFNQLNIDYRDQDTAQSKLQAMINRGLVDALFAIGHDSAATTIPHRREPIMLIGSPVGIVVPPPVRMETFLTYQQQFRDYPLLPYDPALAELGF
jgi:hypothetical protein